MFLHISENTYFEVRFGVWIPIKVRLERACLYKIADTFLITLIHY